MLYRVRGFMREQMHAAGVGRCVAPRAEINVLADRIRARSKLGGGVGRSLVRMNSDCRQIRAQSVLKHYMHMIGERYSGACRSALNILLGTCCHAVCIAFGGAVCRLQRTMREDTLYRPVTGRALERNDILSGSCLNPAGTEPVPLIARVAQANRRAVSFRLERGGCVRLRGLVRSNFVLTSQHAHLP